MVKHLVSIIIPTLNRCSLLGMTLDSILKQSYQNWECIVVDDGSTDATFELMEFYVAKDSRITFFRRPDFKVKGASSCRNYGFGISQGEFIQFLDSDDIISKEKLQNQVTLLKNHPSSDIVTCRWGRFRNKVEDATVYKKLPVYSGFESLFDFFKALSVSKGYFPPHVYLIRRRIIESAGEWNEDLTLNDDGEFMTRVLLKAKMISFEERSIAFYRLSGGDNLSLFNNPEAVCKAIYSWILIDTYFKIKFKESNPFIVKAKDGLYLNLKRSYPDLISAHKFFFKAQKKNPELNNSFYKSIREKVERLF